jgi:hypothetical protein
MTADLQFLQALKTARPPMRADRSAAGTMPTRAFRYCEAMTSAAGFGYWVFPPCEIVLMWDGTQIFWNCAGSDHESWQPLSAMQAPGFAAEWDASAPADLAGCSPPMMTAIPEPGVLQIWSGLFARTAPGWSLLVRAPANLPAPGGYVPYEGVVETDRWFGPLFTNIRLTRTHTPILLKNDYPLLQVQPIPRALYTDMPAADVVCAGVGGFGGADWDDYRTSIAEPTSRPGRPFGSYATAARKRIAAGCPV